MPVAIDKVSRLENFVKFPFWDNSAACLLVLASRVGVARGVVTLGSSFSFGLASCSKSVTVDFTWLTMADHVSLSRQEKAAIELEWQPLAQSGVQMVVATKSPADTMHCVYLYIHGQEAFFQYHDSPSMNWERELYVSGANNKKEARLLAKMEILASVSQVRIAGGTHTIMVVN